MSDCFDHALDAFDSLDYGDRYENNGYDPMLYYTNIDFVQLIQENKKSYFFSISISNALEFLGKNNTAIIRRNLHLMQPCIGVWLPKKVIKYFNPKTKTVTIHSGTLRKCLHSAFEYRYPEIYKD